MRHVFASLTAILTVGLLAGCATGIDYAAATSWRPGQGMAPFTSPASCAPTRPEPCAEPVSCRTRSSAPRTTPYGEVYAGVSAAALPAWGGSISFGQVFSRTPLATWSIEGDATFQDLENEIGGAIEGGRFAQVRGSVKASFNPCGRGHFTARAGGGWLRSTGETDLLGTADDYVTAHLGAGYEFDITKQLTTGPEITAVFAAAEKSSDVIVLPQVRWHFIWKF